MARFDWYQATVYKASPETVAGSLRTRFDLSEVRPSRAKNGYLRGADIKRGDMVLARVWWGGNPGVHVIGSGSDAPDVASVLDMGRRINGWEVLPTRVDSCVDWVEELLFSRLAAQLIQYAIDNDISINQQGDWERNKARTLYLGSRASTVQLVLYEKGYESGGDLNWVRLEVRVYPKPHARAKVATWGPDDVFNAAPWLVKALASVGFEGLRAGSVGTVWRPSDSERARLMLIRQYGRIMKTWADEVGGWQAFGLAVGELADNPVLDSCEN